MTASALQFVALALQLSHDESKYRPVEYILLVDYMQINCLGGQIRKY